MAQWIPLMDYAVKHGVSLSTLRRYIKANKIPYKVESGRYLLREDAPAPESVAASATVPAPVAPVARANSARGDSAAFLVNPSRHPAQSGHAGHAGGFGASANSELEHLKAELRKAREEIAELKMLVAIYEDQLHQAPSSPNHRFQREI